MNGITTCEKIPASAPIRRDAVVAISRNSISFCVLCMLGGLIFSGCVSAHKKGRTTHELFEYQVIQIPGCRPVAVLTRHEIWRDEFKGGGVAFLSDPKASGLVSAHTNQAALGGSSSLAIGSIQSEVSTNGIIAVGNASGTIIEKGGAAAGQLINKAVTGKP